MAGDIVATTGDGGALTASAWAFDPTYNRVSPTYTYFLSIAGAGASGGWTGFGTMQANGTDLPTSTTLAYGNGGWATIATYTVTGATVGHVTLTFSTTGPSNGWVGGFKPDGTDDNGTIGTNTAVTIAVTQPLVLPPTVTPITANFNGSANSVATYGMGTFTWAVSPATNDLTLTPTLGGGAATSYQWTVVSETAAPFGTNLAKTSFESPTSAITRVRFTRNGTYTLQLAATNTAGTGTGTIQIRVTSCKIDGVLGVVNASDRGRMNSAFNTVTNLWCDITVTVASSTPATAAE